MTQMIREPNLNDVDAVSDSLARPRTGVAFVPCAICLAPVDFAGVAGGDAQLCHKHRAADYAPLH
jgi:hypothetical protein